MDEELVQAAGAALRHLRPCSPDMNPIEKACSKLQAFVLQAFVQEISERAVAGLLAACADVFKPAECEAYFRSRGYEPDGELNPA